MAQKKRKLIKIPTPEILANAALFYLARYAASEASLRRNLTNKLRRASMVHTEFASDQDAQAKLRAAIDDIIARHVRTGALNDSAYADMKVSSLRRAGRSTRMIQQKLAMKGVASETVKIALAARDEDDTRGADLTAAQAVVKRRRLGVHRGQDITPEQMRKDLASLARAGFPLDIARQALGNRSDDDIYEGD